MAFFTGNTNEITERLRITATGLVRVGGSGSSSSLLTVIGSLSLKEQAAADADTAAYGQIWVKSDTPNTLYFTDDAGTDFKIGGSGMGGSSAGIGCHVSLSANQEDIPNNTWTKIEFDTEQFDIGGDWDATTDYDFTCPVAGYYLVGVLVRYQNLGDGDLTHVKVQVNGADVVPPDGSVIGDSLGTDPTVNFHDVLSLSANDVITFETAQNSGIDKNLMKDHCYAYILYYGS